VQSEFIEGIVRRDPAGAFERLSPFLDPANVKKKEQVAFAHRILGAIEGDVSGDDEPEDEDTEVEGDDPSLRAPSVFRTDPRWVDAAIALLDHPDLQRSALGVCAAAQSDAAREAVLSRAGTLLKTVNAWRLLRVLGRFRDPRIVPLLIEFLDKLKGYWGRRVVYEAMRSHDDPALAKLFEAWLKGKKRLEEREKNMATALLEFLQRDRSLTRGV